MDEEVEELYRNMYEYQVKKEDLKKGTGSFSISKVHENLLEYREFHFLKVQYEVRYGYLEKRMQP